jgi:folate-dependent phosphoribosylglycinamide formyltransferase PurN
MDTGPVIAQAAVPVLAGDTPESLGSRVLAAEHKLYPLALTLLASGRVKISSGKVEYSTSINQDGVLFSPSLAAADT